jgi:hypothetical protein
MTFPSGVSVTTSNLDSGSDDPSQARANLLTAVQTLNQLVASENIAYGVAVLNGSAQIAPEHIPASLAPSSTLYLQPTGGIVKVEDRVRLQIKTAAQVLAWTDSTVGDMCLIADDLTGATPKLAMYDGSHWRYLALSTWTQVT